MMTPRLLVVLFGLAIGFSTVAIGKEKKLTLKDVIYTPDHLASHLSTKTLVQSDPRSPNQREELMAAFQKGGLDKKTALFQFPEAGQPAVAKTRVPPRYPFQLRRAGVVGEVDSLILVGADGKVLSIYCYKYAKPQFAIAAAAALAKWSYTPAKIGGVTVPVILQVPIVFTLHDD